MSCVEGKSKLISVNRNDELILLSATPHFVITGKDMLAFGANFIPLSGLPYALSMYSNERMNAVEEDESFPCFEVLIILLMHVYMHRKDAADPCPKMFKHFLDTLFQFDSTKQFSTYQMSKSKVRLYCNFLST